MGRFLLSSDIASLTGRVDTTTIMNLSLNVTCPCSLSSSLNIFAHRGAGKGGVSILLPASWNISKGSTSFLHNVWKLMSPLISPRYNAKVDPALMAFTAVFRADSMTSRGFIFALRCAASGSPRPDMSATMPLYEKNVFITSSPVVSITSGVSFSSDTALSISSRRVAGVQRSTPSSSSWAPASASSSPKSSGFSDRVSWVREWT
mmetsp:Transcript_9584/g.27169  ORF Transcript_9584/g.27169 Transcript_9584/m.27169 type:complete len:205 (+) Transcript_9584:284-898(+)